MAAKLITCQAVDYDGNVLSGAKLSVYEAGTTTRRNIYKTADLASGTSETNPAIATSSGAIAVWVDDAAGNVKVTLTNSAETTTYFNQDNLDLSTSGNFLIFPLGGSGVAQFESLTLGGSVSFSGVTTDPNADRLMFWDDSASQVAWLTASTGLTLTGTALTVSANLQALESTPLTTDELSQLQNIGATTISAGQWGYLGGATAHGGALMASASASVTRTLLNLDNLDNTSDADKPISTATQTALNAKLDSSSYTAADVRAKVEAATDSNVFTDADHTKLNGIESGATADQTGAEIKAAYEGEANTNAFTDAEKAKLGAIPSDADATPARFEDLDAAFAAAGNGDVVRKATDGSGYDFAAGLSPTGTMATQDADSVNIDGGAIDNAAIGATTPATGAFTSITVNRNDGAPLAALGGNAGTYRYARFSSGGSARWDAGLTDGAESGSNAGSDFFLNRFDDTGGYLGRAIGISRQTGRVSLDGGLTSSSDVELDGGAALSRKGEKVFNVKAFGAKGDGRTVSDAAVSVSTPTVLVSATISFTSADVGKKVVLRGAGPATTIDGSGPSSLYTTIASVVNATTAITADPVSVSAGNADLFVGTDDTAAINAAIAALVDGSTLYFPPGRYAASGIDIANKSLIEISGERAELWQAGAEANTLFHVQSSCENVLLRGLRFRGFAAVRDRTNGRFSGVHARLDASHSQYVDLEASGAADFGIFIGQNASALTSYVRLVSCRSYDNVGDGFHFGHLDEFTVTDCHAWGNGDDNFGLVGYEAAAAPLKNGTLSQCTAKGGEYRGFLIKHCENVTLADCRAEENRGAGFEINVFRDDSGAQTGFLTHYNDNVNINNFVGRNNAKDFSSAGAGIYHVNTVNIQGLNIQDSGTSGGNECSNIIIFNVLNCFIRGGFNRMSRAGGGQGIFYWNQNSFEGRDHRFIEASYDNPDAGSTEQISINDVDFRMEVSVAGRYDIWLLPNAGSAGGQDNKIDKISAVTITGNRSGSYKGDQVGDAQAVIRVDPAKVDFLDVGQTDVRNSADNGTETVKSNRNVFGHGVHLG